MRVDEKMPVESESKKSKRRLVEKNVTQRDQDLDLRAVKG